MSEYTQGVCQDGAAILKDGKPMTIEKILEGLRERDAALIDRDLIKAEAIDEVANSLLLGQDGNIIDKFQLFRRADDIRKSHAAAMGEQL